MMRYGSRDVRGGVVARLCAGLSVLLVAGACSFASGPDNVPTSARVRIEGTGPDLQIIVSTDFFEQIDLSTGERLPVPNRADTFAVTLPYDQTFDLEGTGSVYVELNNPVVATASVRLRVDLDNGAQAYDQSATLSDDASLIYYFLFS